MMMLFCVHHMLSAFISYTLWYVLLCLWCILYLFFNTVVYFTCSCSACLSACELSFKSLCCICLIFMPACINLVVSYGDLGKPWLRSLHVNMTFTVHQQLGVGGERISLFEKQASRISSHLRRSFHKHELKKIALEYEQKLNDLAIRKEKALIEVKQRFRCESDNLERVAKISPSTITNKNDAADLNKVSDKLVDQSDNLKEVAKPSWKCEITPVSNNNSQEEDKQKQVSHVPRVNYSSQCSRHLSSNNNTSAFRDDAHSYLDVGVTSFSSHLVSSCTVSNSGIFVNPNSAVCFRTSVKEESSPWDTSANLMQSDAQCVENLSACIDNLLESKHAEEIPSSDLNVTDTVCVRSVPGAFPPRKPAKHVVFYSTTKVHGMCLNESLLKTPDLINSQVDLFSSCGTENVVLSSDINLMSYNFLVSLGFRDYICFLWCHCTHRSYRFTQSMFVLYM